MSIVNTLAHTASYTGGTVRTYSTTVPSGDDRILFVTHAKDDPAVSGGFSVTFDGVALTKLAGNGANTNGMAVYYLVNPSVGAHDLVWTNGSTFTSGLFGEYVFTGVDQTTPLGTPFTLFQPYVSSSTSASFTSVDGGVIFSFAQIKQTTSVVQTSPADLLTSDVYSLWTIGTAKSQPGATSIGWQGWGADKPVNHIAVMMNPAAASGPVTHVTTGALTAGAATMAGTSAHIATHVTSGALAAGAATMAGTSAREGAATTHVTTGALVAGAATLDGTASHAASGSFVSDVLGNNTSSIWASTAVVWEWREGTGIGVAPTSVTYGTGTTSSLGVLTCTGLPTGAGELLVATTDYTGVAYQRGTVA